MKSLSFMNSESCDEPENKNLVEEIVMAESSDNEEFDCDTPEIKDK